MQEPRRKFGRFVERTFLANKRKTDLDGTISRRNVLISTVCGTSLGLPAIASTFLSSPAFASDQQEQNDIVATATAERRRLRRCDKSSACISTASVKQIDSYSPPWTFECSWDEAYARLKGTIFSDSTLRIIESDADAGYLKAIADRNPLVQDELEFVVWKGNDKIVSYRSAQKSGGPDISDFGANKIRMESLRKRAGVFDLMGSGFTADSYNMHGETMDPLRQLKSFYGYQTGLGNNIYFQQF